MVNISIRLCLIRSEHCKEIRSEWTSMNIAFYYRKSKTTPRKVSAALFVPE
jgi:hypothetical protein